MIVIDTHALVWAVQDDPKLGQAARQRIVAEAKSDGVLVPAICAWEIALIVSRGQVELGLEPADWLRRVLKQTGYRLAELDRDIAAGSVALDWSHKDPADRMIVATARHWAAPVLTADRTILAYAGCGHLQAIDAGR